MTDAGTSPTPVTLGALIVSVPTAVALLRVAVRFTGVWVATGEVVTVTVPVLEPAAITTVAGVVNDVLPEVRPTVRPPAGAGSLSVTVA